MVLGITPSTKFVYSLKDLSLLERSFVVSEFLNSLTVPVFVPSCQAAPALQDLAPPSAH